MNALMAIALHGFRESRRNRVTVVVYLFAFIMIFSATFALELTVSTFERVMTDMGLGVMSLICVGLTIFLGSGLLPKEIERRTIFMVLARPVSRSAFVVGRLIGNVLTVWFIALVMGGLFVAQILFEGTAVTGAHLVAMGGLFLEVVMLTSISFAFAAASSQFVTAVSTVGLYFIGHMASDLYKLAQRSEAGLLRYGGKALYYLLPNLERVDFKARATYLDPTSASEFLGAAGYALGYSAVLIVVACFLFERRDFK